MNATDFRYEEVHMTPEEQLSALGEAYRLGEVAGRAQSDAQQYVRGMLDATKRDDVMQTVQDIALGIVTGVLATLSCALSWGIAQ